MLFGNWNIFTQSFSILSGILTNIYGLFELLQLFFCAFNLTHFSLLEKVCLHIVKQPLVSRELLAAALTLVYTDLFCKMEMSHHLKLPFSISFFFRGEKSGLKSSLGLLKIAVVL